jgi:hypothetical protein
VSATTKNDSYIGHVYPKATTSFTFEQAKEYFSHGREIHVYIGNVLMEKNIINTPNAQIKAYHVGMIGSSLTVEYIDGINPVRDIVPKIRIHNQTLSDISINGVKVGSGKTEIYYGEDHLGIVLGQQLIDASGSFPDFDFKAPASDVYYGITSDIPRSLFSGYQPTSKFEPDETVHNKTELFSFSMGTRGASAINRKYPRGIII